MLIYHTPMGDYTLTASQIALIQTRIIDWGKTHFRRFPWRRDIPLWKGLLVELMLQRTKATQVVRPFKFLDQRFPTASSLSELTDADIEPLLSSLGLKWRIPLFIELTHIISKSAGRLPRSEHKLSNLPGIGPYSSAAALSMHGGVRAVIIDSNTVRIVCRIIGVGFDGETRRRPWLRKALEILTPVESYRSFNFALLDLGAELCRPSNPRCTECPIQEGCFTGRAARY